MEWSSKTAAWPTRQPPKESIHKGDTTLIIFHDISTSCATSGRGSPRATELTSSLLPSGPICECGLTRITSRSASFWSGVKSGEYLESRSEMEYRCPMKDSDLWQKANKL